MKAIPSRVHEQYVLPQYLVNKIYLSPMANIISNQTYFCLSDEFDSYVSVILQFLGYLRVY